MKKLSLLIFILVFAASAVGLAAPSSSKSMSAPKPPATQTAPKAPAPTQTAPASEYKPSAPASSYSNTAPKPAQSIPQATQPSGGGFLRTIGMVGSGMLIGGLLGNMFGFGHSAMLTSLIGILFNILVLVGILMVGRYLWNRFKTGRAHADRRN